MPDDPPSAKKLIKKCLKTGPQPVADVRAVVLQKLVADGKAKKKAEKLIEAKLQLPCFALGADNILRLAGKDDGKRSAGATAAAPPSKKAKVEARRSPRLAAAAADATGVPAIALQQPAAGGKAPTMVGAAAATAFFKEHNIELSGRGADGFRPVAAFADTGFGANVLRACASFSKPTPIQAVCWPIAASGRDTVGVAETGSGKTLAFILPALELVGRARARGEAASGVQVLVLAPTRELAMQSDAVCAAAAKGCGFNSICVYGGVPKPPQREAIRKGAEVVIATPGRLLDLNSEGAAPLGTVSFLVLDEADRMLDMGFEKDVRTIIGFTPSTRRTVMFTATWPQSIRALAEEFLSDPVRVTVGSQELTANHRVTQLVEVVEQHEKETKLPILLERYHKSRTNRVLVFALYKKEAARVEETLRRRGYNAIGIHGDMTQAARTHALQQFKEGKTPLLVATDVAARGLDIPDVEVVINYTFPLTIEDYIHRIGRTGRAGKLGTSHTLFTTFDKPHAGALQNVLREAGQEVPDALMRFGSAVKKKEHKMYGAFAGSSDAPMKQATKIRFD